MKKNLSLALASTNKPSASQVASSAMIVEAHFCSSCGRDMEEYLPMIDS
jgi:hypothetical protein